MNKLNEVLKLLIDLNPQELRTVISEAKDRIIKNARNSLTVGSIVKIPRDRDSKLYTITKVNKVNFVIKQNDTNVKYNCPPSLLERVIT